MMRGRPKLPKPGALIPSQVRELASKESKRQALTDKLYDRAMNEGDNAAARAWLDLQEEEDAPNLFNCNVQIVPYAILDPSLADIISQAETPVVLEMLDGLRQRVAHDEGPPELRELIRCLSLQYQAWADVKYAPEDA